MSENKNRKTRTYARNRTKLSRRGFEKNIEKDGVFILKLLLSVIIGSFWLRLSKAGDSVVFAVPAGVLLGILIVSRLENRSENRKIFYAVILICGVLSYFLPIGIVV